MNTLVAILYLISAVIFILGMKGLTKVRSARRGNTLAALAMLIAIVATLMEIGVTDYRWIVAGVLIGTVIGAWAAVRVAMTSMPEMVALFNGCGGAASALVVVATYYLMVVEAGAGSRVASVVGGSSALTMVLSIIIGGVTFSGSILAFLKLKGTMRSDPILLPGRHVLNAVLLLASLGAGALFATSSGDGAMVTLLVWVTLVLSLALGVTLVLPIGGADMPVVISLLNSYSGVAAAATGFVIGNSMLIIAGALVGASGLILTRIMCDAMNRSLANVMFGGFGAVAPGGVAAASSEYGPVRSGGAEEAAMLLDSAEKVMVVPGYGLAVAQAQHVVKEIAAILEAKGAQVLYAIHPVAGRMPGHMNVLLAEADIPYEQLLEMDRANGEFNSVDVVLVVGANDVVNPAARTSPGSPIYGMPILDVLSARSVIVIKRSLGAGFAGIKNELFENEKTMMVFMDAKEALQSIASELKSA